MKERFGKFLKEKGIPLGLGAAGLAFLYHKQYLIGAALLGIGAFIWSRGNKESGSSRQVASVHSTGSERVSESSYSLGRITQAEAALAGIR